MPATSSNNKNDIKIVINSDKKPKRKYKKRANRKRPVDTPLTISNTSANPAPAFNYGGMVNKQPYDTQSSAIQRETIAKENRAYLEEMRNRNLRGGSLNHTDANVSRLAESLVNDNFIDPLEQRVPPILSPLQKSILRHNSHHNEFETLSAPAGHWENPNDISNVANIFQPNNYYASPFNGNTTPNTSQVADEDSGSFFEVQQGYNAERHTIAVQTEEHRNPVGGRPRASTLNEHNEYNQLVYVPSYENREINTNPRDINLMSGGGFNIQSTDDRHKETRDN